MFVRLTVEYFQADIPPAWRSKCLGQVKSLELNPTSRHRDADFCVLDEDAPEGDGVYVDLYENPERFTGYAGHSANRVWKAIYEENCFGVVPFLPPSSSMETGGTGYIGKNLLSNNNQGVRSLMGSLGLAAPRDPQSEEQCREKRVYYRLISGLHASISIHICAEYLDQKSGEWRPNLECFITRIAEHPERLQNVYFDYVLMLRALTKAAPYLRTFNYTLGDTSNDEQTKTLVKALLDKTESCTATFDETSMFTGGPEARILKQEFKDHFRNVSRIMDCVGCDKCRLWGKTQVTGLATALKLLFSFDESACRSEDFSLKRSEIISFIWTLHRFSESLAAVEHFRNMWAQRNNAEEPVKSSPRSAASEPTSNLDPQPSSRSAPTNTAAMYDIPDAEETSVSKFHSPLVDAGSTTFASNKTGVMSPRHSAFAKSDFLAKLYHTCRNSFAACFMILERVISIVSSRILDSKQEL